MTNQIHEMVRDHYAKAALEVLDQDITCGGACCGDACCGGCGTAARRSPSPARRCGAR